MQFFCLPKELKKPCYREDVLTTMNSSRAETSGLWSLSEMWTQLLAAHLRVAHQGVAPCLKHRYTHGRVMSSVICREFVNGSMILLPFLV